MFSPALSFYESDTEPNGNYKSRNFPTEVKDVSKEVELWFSGIT